MGREEKEGMRMAFKRVFTFEDPSFPRPRMLGIKAANEFEERWASLDVTSAELAILSALRSLGAATSTSIGSRLLIDRPTARRLIRELGAKGAVDIVHSAKSSDAVLEITEGGASLLDLGMAALSRRDSNCLDTIADALVGANMRESAQVTFFQTGN